GISQIYVKMSDGSVEPPQLTGVSPAVCEGIGIARTDVTFSLVATCPNTAEFMDRYLVYYGGETSEGSTPNGPFPHRPVVPASGGGTASLTVQFVLGPACPLNPTLAITSVQSNGADPGGPAVFGNMVCAPPVIPAIDCSSTCMAASCVVGTLTSSSALKGAKL